MTRQNKILLASTLTVLAAFMTIICLFAMNGISVKTVIALAASYFFAQLTISSFKVETLLRKKDRQAKRRVAYRRNSLCVVKGTKAGSSAA